MGFWDRLFRRRRAIEASAAPRSPVAFDEELAAVVAQRPTTADAGRAAGERLFASIDIDRLSLTSRGLDQIDQALAALGRARLYWTLRSFSDRVLSWDETTIQSLNDAGERDRLRRDKFARLLGPRGLRYRIHALVETGSLDEALRLSDAFKHCFDRTCVDFEAEYREVLGFRGRIYKQRYLDASGARLKEPILLQKAIDAYAQGYARSDPKSLWHGANVIALMRRASKDGVSAPAAAAFNVHDLGAEIIALADDPNVSDDHWRHASAAEACLALGRWEDAEARFATFVSEAISKGRATDLVSTNRQLREVWGFGGADSSEMGTRLLAQLDVASARAPARDPVPLGDAPSEAARGGVVLSELDRRLSTSRATGAQMQTFDWVELIHARGRAVGLVIDRSSKKGVGTGFLLAGEDLHSAWKGRTLFVTNYHVVNRDGAETNNKPALRPARAQVSFTRTDDEREFALKAVLWQSPVSMHDVCILEIDGTPEGVEPLPLRRGDDAVEAITVVGHPLGEALSLSLENRSVKGVETPTDEPKRTLLRYDAPTSEGCSGGPVLDWHDLSLVAIHHGKSMNNPLDSEGIMFDTVVAAIAKYPEGL